MTAMGMLDVLFSMEEKDKDATDLSIEDLQRMTTAHCLLLPYVLPNVSFAKRFAVVYDNWDMEGMNGKTSMTPCNTILNN